MLARQVGTDDLRSGINGFEINRYSLPARAPIGVSQETTEDFRIQSALVLEVFVKRTVRHASSGHDLLHRNIVESTLVELFSRAFDDPLFGRFAITRGIRHL